jgi:hypothetical protein
MGTQYSVPFPTMFNVSFPQLLKENDAYKATAKTKLNLEKKLAKEASKVFEHSLVRQYIEDDTKQTVWRLSQIGRQPALEILARHFGVIPVGGSSTVSPQQRYLFHVGDTFEAWVVFTLKRLGYTILGSQTPVNYYGIGGHIDFLCRDETDGEIFVLETKTACGFYFDQCEKYGTGDERGYLTQLGAYVESFKEKYPNIQGYWLMTHKDTQAFHIEKVQKEKYEPRLERLRKIVDASKTLTCFDEAYTLFRPQPPSVELKAKQVAYWSHNDRPKLYVPATIKYPDLHYVWYDGKNIYGQPRKYVYDYYYPEQYQSFKPNVDTTALANMNNH